MHMEGKGSLIYTKKKLAKVGEVGRKTTVIRDSTFMIQLMC